MRFAIALILSLPTLPLVAEVALTLPQFRTELNRVSESVTRVKDDRAGLAILAGTLPEHWTVQEAGQRWEVPTDWLRDALAEDELDYAGIEARLTAMSEAAAIPAHPAKEDGANAKMNAILNRSEFS